MHDQGHRLSRVFQSIKGGRGRGHLFRERGDLEGDLRDRPQCPLRADNKPCDIIPGGAFHGACPRAHHVPVCQDHFQPEDIIPGGTVFCSPEAAGVGPNVSPQGAYPAAGRVRGKKEAMGPECGLKIIINHPGLNNGQSIRDPDAQDLVHAQKVKDDAPFDRNRMA